MARTYNLKKNETTSPKWSPLVSKIKEQISIADVADKLGIIKKYNLKKTGTSLQGDCPTGHTSANHSCFSVDTDENLYYCFSCGKAGDILSMVELVESVSFIGALRWLIDAFTPDLKAELDDLFSNLSHQDKVFFERGNLYRAVFEHEVTIVASPSMFALSQNYPNPFNPTTVIGYSIASASHVALKVYDLLGREVATLVNGQMAPGNYTATFDGSRLSSGVYFYRLDAGTFTDVKRLSIME